MPKSRFFLILLLAFILGVAIRSFFPVASVLLLAGIAGSAILLSFGIKRKEKRHILAGFFLIAVLAGIFRYEQVLSSRPDLSFFYGKNLAIQGIVAEGPELSGSFSRLKIKVEAVNGNKISKPFFALATLRKFPEYKLGDEILADGVLEKPEKVLGDFDYPSYLSRQDIFTVMAFPKIEKIGEGKGSKIYLALSRFKNAFEKNIDQILPEPHGAFLKGLILGEKSSLPASLVEDFKRTGTSHIVALSGYNITLVGRFFLNVLSFLAIPYNFSFWVASLGITLFVMLTGASASAVRAGIMGVLVLLASREGRAYHMTNALAFAAALMLFQNPRILRFDASFQLSFLATIGLVYLFPYVEKNFERWGKRIRERVKGVKEFILVRKQAKGAREKLFDFKKTFLETISAQLAVLPLLLFLFGRVSLISPLANILVLVAVPYAMAVGFVAGMLGFLSYTLSSIVGWITWVLLFFQIKVIELFAKIPFASAEAGSWVLVFVLAIYALVFYSYVKSRKTL